MRHKMWPRKCSHDRVKALGCGFRVSRGSAKWTGLRHRRLIWGFLILWGAQVRTDYNQEVDQSEPKGMDSKGVVQNTQMIGAEHLPHC